MGTLAVGLFASAATTAGVDGLFYGGGIDQLWRQALGAFAVLLFSLVVTFVIAIAIQRTTGFRVTDEDDRGHRQRRARWRPRTTSRPSAAVGEHHWSARRTPRPATRRGRA